MSGHGVRDGLDVYDPAGVEPASVDRETFFAHIRDALPHLHDRPYLQRHPICSLLAQTTERPAAEAIYRALLDAIDHLQPLGTVQSYAPEWRRYQYLRLRYLEGTSPQDIAQALAFSERQARRLHHDAVDTLAGVLWERYRASGARTSTAFALEPTSAAASSEEPGFEVAAELSRLRVDPGDERTRLDETLAAVITTITPLIERQGGAHRAVARPRSTAGGPRSNDAAPDLRPDPLLRSANQRRPADPRRRQATDAARGVGRGQQRRGGPTGLVDRLGATGSGGDTVTPGGRGPVGSLERWHD
jgi:hypothetical protein